MNENFREKMRKFSYVFRKFFHELLYCKIVTVDVLAKSSFKIVTVFPKVSFFLTYFQLLLPKLLTVSFLLGVKAEYKQVNPLATLD